MKCVFYKRLLSDGIGLSPCEKIVYSNLVFQAISSIWRDVVDKECNQFDKSLIEEQGEEIELPFFMFNNNGKFWYANKMSIYCGISQSSISNAYESLCLYGYIDKYRRTIRHNKIYENGYFTLLTNFNLESVLLTFYSWLVSLKGKDGYIYANNKKLSTLYSKKESDIANFIFRLKKLGFVERDKSKRLILIK